MIQTGELSICASISLTAMYTWEKLVSVSKSNGTEEDVAERT